MSTYSAEPPGNNVTYSKPQSVPLKENLIALKFTAEAGSKTVPGKVIVAASIDATTAGVRVKQPETDKEWRAELSTLYP